MFCRYWNREEEGCLWELTDLESFGAALGMEKAEQPDAIDEEHEKKRDKGAAPITRQEQVRRVFGESMEEMEDKFRNWIVKSQEVGGRAKMKKWVGAWCQALAKRVCRQCGSCMSFMVRASFGINTLLKLQRRKIEEEHKKSGKTGPAQVQYEKKMTGSEQAQYEKRIEELEEQLRVERMETQKWKDLCRKKELEKGGTPKGDEEADFDEDHVFDSPSVEREKEVVEKKEKEEKPEQVEKMEVGTWG